MSLSRIIHHSHSFTRLEIYHHIYFIERILFRTLLFCCKADFRSVKIRSYFFNEIAGLASSPKARFEVDDVVIE